MSKKTNLSEKSNIIKINGVMKLMHLSDLHIGKSIADYSLIDDQDYILSCIVDIAVKNQVTGIVIAGDVYDKSIPSEEAVRVFDEFLYKLVKRSILVFVISGNHDSEERLNFGSKLMENRGVYICTKFDGELYCRKFQDEYGVVNIYLLPFVKASVVKHFYPDEDISDYDSAVRKVIEKANIKSEERNILVAHQFVVHGDILPQIAGSENVATKKIVEMDIGLVERIGSACFDAFDYVALGHIHRPQYINRREIRYAGSPLKYSLSEVNSEKSVPIISFSEEGKVCIDFEKLIPRRDLRHIKGKIRELLKTENICDTDDYMYVTLTDEEFIDDAISTIRTVYGNTIKVDYSNSHTKEILDDDLEIHVENRTFEDVFSDFYERIFGMQISDAEMNVIKAAAREAGVADETY